MTKIVANLYDNAKLDVKPHKGLYQSQILLFAVIQSILLTIIKTQVTLPRNPFKG